MAAFRTYVLLVSLGVLFGQSTAGMSEFVCMDDCIAVSVMIVVCTSTVRLILSGRIYGTEPVAKRTYRGIVIILC